MLPDLIQRSRRTPSFMPHALRHPAVHNPVIFDVGVPDEHVVPRPSATEHIWHSPLEQNHHFISLPHYHRPKPQAPLSCEENPPVEAVYAYSIPEPNPGHFGFLCHGPLVSVDTAQE